MPQQSTNAQRSQQSQVSHSGHSGQRYRTLDLVNAQNFGWDFHRGLSHRESQVLTFIAKRGKTSEPDVAFAWFPKQGQEWWASLMGMTRPALGMVLSRLRKKGVLVKLAGSAKDARFSNVTGYAVPDRVMEECLQWFADRNSMVVATIPDTPEDVTAGYTDVTGGDIGVTGCCSDNTVTCGNAEHTQEITQKRETHGLTSASSPSGGSQSDPQGGTLRDQGDGWDQPKDEPDDFAAPRESRDKLERTKRPSSRLTDQFYACWLRSREARVDLALPWSVKVIFQTNLKRLLEDQSEAEVAGMITEFFRLVDQRQIVLKSDDLWKDFWYARGRLVKLAQQQVQTLSTSQAEIDERNRRMTEDLRSRAR